MLDAGPSSSEPEGNGRLFLACSAGAGQSPARFLGYRIFLTVRHCLPRGATGARRAPGRTPQALGTELPVLAIFVTGPEGALLWRVAKHAASVLLNEAL